MWKFHTGSTPSYKERTTMSSKAKKIADQVIETKNYNKYCAENSLLGSIIITCCKLANKRESTAIKKFLEISKDLKKYEKDWKCAKDIIDHFVKFYKIDKYKNHIVMVCDSKNIYTPLVSITAKVNDEDICMPLSEDGVYNGILLHALHDKSDRFVFERVYEDE